MLNELQALSSRLSLRGIKTDKWHPWIQPFKKGKALVAELDALGTLAGVSLLSAGEVARLRKIAPNNFKSFPGFNLKCPLLALERAELWNQKQKLWEVALSVTPDSPLAYQLNDLRRLHRLLGDFPLKELGPRLKGGGPKIASTLAVLERLGKAKFEPSAFIQQLVVQLIAEVERGRFSQSLAIDILYGKPNRGKLQLEAWETTILLDVSDLYQFPYRIADPAAASEWSELLLGSDSPSSSRPFVCALSGESDSRFEGKFPIPNLPVLGLTPLMSMNKVSPCQTRYGRTSSEIFSAGGNSVKGLNDALLFVTRDVRRGKTWTSIPNGFRNRDLLIAYLEEQPDADVSVVSLFADIEPDLEAAEELAIYEVRTSAVFDALRLLATSKDSLVEVIALSQIDKGRKQVVFSGSYKASAIQQARDNWLAGSRNIPRVTIPFPVAKGQKAEMRSDFQPSPMQVLESLKTQWIMAGQESQSVPGVDLGRIYGLFLQPDASSEAAWLLDRYLSLTEPLLIGLARSKSGGAKLSQAARKQALVVISTYGILLYRQGRTKEIYMNSRDYLMGQFLQLADLLHRRYCIHVRNGSLPPQLIGNAAVPMALQRPGRALEVLCTRMMVYLAWADRFQGPDAGLVKWTRKELSRISSLLKDHDLNQGVGANGKAELLLGYLASTKESEN